MNHNHADESADFPTVDRDHDDGTTIVIAGDLLAALFGGEE